MTQRPHIATTLQHSGHDPARFDGFVNPPVVHASTVLHPSADALLEGSVPYTYGRTGTPTTRALEQALMALEGPAAGVVLTPSGLSAITAAMMSVLSAGDHLLVTDSVYHPVRHFCDTVLARMGVTTTYYAPGLDAGIHALLQPNTRLIWTESPGSLTFEVQDLPAIVAVAREHSVLVGLDNTWATPVFFPALAMGVDLSVMACTKYVVGHSDAMLGSVAASERAWPALKRTHHALGLCVGPDDVYLALRGLHTLEVRLQRHQINALALARWLQQQPEVLRVLHPALPPDPGHALWLRDFRGASGLFGFEFQACAFASVKAFLDALELFGLGFSWGGFESLAIPVRAVRSASPGPRPGQLVRLHAGLESADDLIADLDQALERWRHSEQAAPGS
jgi:cystathionine beta-lyase